MKKRMLLIVPALAALGAGAWFEPTQTVRGWVRGEPFFESRSASYWGDRLTSADPTTLERTPERLAAGKATAVPVLARLLNSNDSKVRFHAAEVLVKIGPDADAATPTLLERLTDTDPYVRAVAIEAIAAIKPDRPEVVPALVARLKSDDRDRVIRPLSVFGSAAREAVPGLIEIVKSPLPPATRWNAIRTLGKIGPDAKAATPTLIEALSDSDEFVREHAAETLGDIRATDSVPHLVKALVDPSARVRRDAVRSLGQFGAAAASSASAIEKLFTDPDANVRNAAKTSLRQVAPGKKN
jgi:HEAT repeat protein